MLVVNKFSPFSLLTVQCKYTTQSFLDMYFYTFLVVGLKYKLWVLIFTEISFDRRVERCIDLMMFIYAICCVVFNIIKWNDWMLWEK